MSTRDLWSQINDDTPNAGYAWRSMDSTSRHSIVAHVMKKCRVDGQLEIVHCNDDGTLYFSQSESVAVEQRADFLLDFEDVLKKDIDSGLTVWIEPQIDKNPLRKLRGITVRSL